MYMYIECTDRVSYNKRYPISLRLFGDGRSFFDNRQKVGTVLVLLDVGVLVSHIPVGYFLYSGLKVFYGDLFPLLRSLYSGS